MEYGEYRTIPVRHDAKLWYNNFIRQIIITDIAKQNEVLKIWNNYKETLQLFHQFNVIYKWSS